MKENLLKRNLKAPALKMYTENALLLQEEFWIVYINEQKEKRFIRFGQVDIFCDGMLFETQDALWKIISFESENKKVSYVPNLNQITAHKALEMVEEHIDYHRAIRWFEVHFSLRKRYVNDWRKLEL